MHIRAPRTDVRVPARVSRAVGMAILGLALVVVVIASPARAFAEEPAGEVLVLTFPQVPDSYLGWRRSPTFLTVVPLSPGTVYYTWDDPFGGWRPLTGPIVVPEGKRTFMTRIMRPDGRPSAIERFETRLDYRLVTAKPRVSAQAAPSSTSVRVTARIRAQPGTRILRIGGADRYDTSARISEANFTSAHTVIVATGTNYADALSASGLAGCLDAPVLLTRPTRLSGYAAEEIRRLRASRAIVVGGEAAVSRAVASDLVALGLAVERIGGRDRYETAAFIGNRVMTYGNPGGRVFIARGDDFADALSLGPLAYSSNAPLVLVRPATVPPATRSFLGAHSFSSGCIAGGTVAVSEAVEREVDRYVGQVIRLAGNSRYSTSVAVAAWAVSEGIASYEMVGIATGVDFADALCGGIAAGANGGVILLTRPGDLPAATSDAMQAVIRDIRDVQVYGGEVAIQPGVISSISSMAR